jgi:hypothetical protein
MDIATSSDIFFNYCKKRIFYLLASSSTAPTNNGLYSDKHIRCRGRACAKCGRCRDWYWRCVNRKMHHTKRSDAICILGALDYYEYDGNYLYSDYHTVCQCDDNHV